MGISRILPPSSSSLLPCQPLRVARQISLLPLEGGTQLCTATYDKGSVWNAYQEVTYKLPRRLRGVTDLCFVFRQKVHIKGFVFTKYQKAFQRLSATECDSIYGDSFKVKADTIENIGNNVSLVFENMDFGSQGAGGVALRWRSNLVRNPIQFVFACGAEEIKQMVEVDRADTYISRIFTLSERIRGKKRVSLVFLPGCSLDLAWLQFLE